MKIWRAAKEGLSRGRFILCWWNGRHVQVYRSTEKREYTRIIKTECRTCGRQEEEVVVLGGV